MATKLEKNIIRESSVEIEGKEVIITLTQNQEIHLKLKGVRKKPLSIPIENLYNQLSGRESNIDEKPKAISVSRITKTTKENPMIDLYSLRSHNAISTLDLSTLAKFDQIIKSVINENIH